MFFASPYGTCAYLICSHVRSLLVRRGMHLTDLTFIEDGNPDKINGLINFKKRELLIDTISIIQQFILVRVCVRVRVLPCV